MRFRKKDTTLKSGLDYADILKQNERYFEAKAQYQYYGQELEVDEQTMAIMLNGCGFCYHLVKQ